MTTILNYLKGNYLISNFPFLITLECETSLNNYSQKLLTYSMTQNQKPNDRFSINFKWFLMRDNF